jgi:hypothetical protein
MTVCIQRVTVMTIFSYPDLAIYQQVQHYGHCPTLPAFLIPL